MIIEVFVNVKLCQWVRCSLHFKWL